MPFLQSLRMANIFPRKPAEDRPFGMPDIDSGNIGELLRQIGPLADTMNRDQMRTSGRSSGLDSIASGMRQRPSGLDLSGQGIAANVGARGSVFNPNINTRLGGDVGPTPVQRGFLAQDAAQKAGEQHKEDMDINFMRGVDEAKAREQHQLELADKDVAAKTSLFNRELAGRKEMADVQFGHSKELEGQRQKSAADIAAANVASRRGDVIARETTRGEQARLTQKEKPVSMLPSQQDNDFQNKVQKMMIDNPNVAPFIEKDDKGMIRISDRATPEQAEWIKNHLGSAGSKPSEGKVIRQRNKTTGEIRESSDGGKTWKMVGK